MLVTLVSDSLLPRGRHGLKPLRLLCPWDSPGKNSGVGCHFLLQGIFLTQELNIPTWQADSLPSELPGKLASSGENIVKRLCLQASKFSPEADWLELWSCTSNLPKSEKINFYNLTHLFCDSPSWVIYNICQVSLCSSVLVPTMIWRMDIKALCTSELLGFGQTMS